MTLIAQNGGDVLAVDAFDATPMHIAAQDQLIEAITILIKTGGSESGKDSQGEL